MQHIETPEEWSKRRDKALWALVNETEKESKKSATAVILIFGMIGFIILLLVMAAFLKPDDRFFPYLLASVTGLVIVGFAYNIYEGSNKLSALVRRYLRTEEEL